MRIDALLSFVAIGSPLSLIAGAGVDVATDPIDLLGLGAGITQDEGNVIIGNPTVFGAPDAGGVGGLRPELNVTTGAADFVAGTGTPTLNVQLQAAIDDGTGNPGSYSTLIQTGELTLAQLVANTVIARFPWVPPFPENLRPRFLRLNFAIPAGTDFSTASIASALVVPARDDWFQRQAARNYAVS